MALNSRLELQTKKAFTLIELLVVIAIIALLLSILMPALQKVKEQARTLICQANLRSIGMIILLYLEDNKGKAFDADKCNGFYWKDTNGDYRNLNDYITANDNSSYWGLGYKSYIDDPDMFECPSFPPHTKLIYPVDPKLIEQAAFGLNENVNDKKVYNLTSEKFIVTHDHVEPKMDGESNDMFYNEGLGTDNLTQYREGGSREMYYRGIFRHNVKSYEPFKTGGRANILWLDGHVDSIEETTGDDVERSWYTGE